MSSPFNETRYKELLEGLEVSEVSFNYVKKSNDVFRFDSNFFQREFLVEESLIRSKSFRTLKELGVELKSFGAYSLNNDVNYINSGIPFIRGVNMKKGRIIFNEMIYIDEKANSLLWKSEVKPEMVLLSMSGTIGEVALASKKWKYPINSNQDIAKLDTNGKINSYFLFAFLLSKFGQNYLKREARGSVQQHVFLSQMELFEIPILKSIFYEKIEELIKESDDKLFLSEDFYQQAENLLLFELGLASLDKPTLDRLEKGLQPKTPDELMEELQDPTNQLRALFDAAIDETINMLDENPNLIAELREQGRDDLAEKIEKGIRTKIALTEYQIEQIKTDRYYYSKHYQNQINLIELYEAEQQNTNIKSFSESFGSTGRLDAEYYQKKYEKYIQLIKSLPNGFGLLSNVCTLKDTNLIPEDSKDYKYIELADVGKSGEITSCTNAKGVELPSRARRLVKTGDVIISSIEGSLNSCALITEDFNDALCSTGFFIIKSDLINSETLLVLFKSELMQNILKQNCSGTILTAINKTEVQNIPIPFIDKDIQKQIKEGISESFRLRSQSEHLLAVAKRAVELAIEEGEEMGLKYLNKF